MANQGKDVDLLLIGKTGNGKSALGNMLLKRDLFESKAVMTSVTKRMQINHSDFYGRVITVVDGPGIGDTDLDAEAGIKLAVDSIKLSIAASPDGYHAFLLVVRFGGRFTKEDKKTIDILKGIFGTDFVKKYCILCMTCGDNYKEKESFRDWCKAQTGVFDNLVKECNGRVVLFDNITKDSKKIDKQINELLSLVDGLAASGHRYRDDHFRKAQKERDRIMVEAKVPMIQRKTMKEASLIIQKLGKFNVQEPQQRLKALEGLAQRAQILVDSVLAQDKGTGALKVIINNARNIQGNVQEQIRITKNAIDNEVKRREHKAEMDRLKAQLEKRLQEQKEGDRRAAEAKIAQIEKEEHERRARMDEMVRGMMRKTQQVEKEYVQV
ncbi:unnamed protein product, partial [Lymnaea stagnalis]